MLLNKSAAKLLLFFEICKFFCIFSVIHYVKDQSIYHLVIYHLVIWLFCNHAGDQTRMAFAGSSHKLKFAGAL